MGKNPQDQQGSVSARKQAAEQAKPEWERKWEARELARAHGYIPYLCDEVAAYRF